MYYDELTKRVAYSDRTEQIVTESLREFGEMQTNRALIAGQCEEIALLIWPETSNTFFFGSYNWPGAKRTYQQVDSTGMLALARFAAITDSLLTPANQTWHALRPEDEYLAKDRSVTEWFESTTRKLFSLRNNPNSNFAANNHAQFKTVGAYGTSAVQVDKFYDPYNQGKPGFRYRHHPFGEMFYRENFQGLVDGYIRWFKLTAMQAKQMFPDTFPEKLLPHLKSFSQVKFDFLQRVVPRDEYDPENKSADNMPYASYYLCVDSRELLEESGYLCLPVAASRYDRAPGETYGRSIATMVLPSLKSLNAMKATSLKLLHRSADPVLLTADDGLIDSVSLRPGAMNKGGMSADGKPLIGTLPTGNIQADKEAREEEASLINNAFLVSLFQILTETPQMSATEVIERAQEKGILLAPTLGRQGSEYLGSLIHRELVLGMQLGLFDPMPPALKEAGGAYGVVYDGPLARAAKAQFASGFMRTLQSAQEVVNVTGDTSLLDVFDFDTALPEIAKIQGVPVTWLASDDEVAKKRKARAQAQARQEAIQAAPAQAAMMKAQAVAGQSQQGAVAPQSAPGQPVQPPPLPGPGNSQQ
jgi:Bacteriophage head to tail connecting protein